MKISTKMLENLLGFLPENLYDLTNAYITEVEDYTKLVEATGLVTGHVLTCVDHENSDHLHVTTVDLGHGLVEQIVCGAKNVAAGQYVVVATPGAMLPGGFEIKRSKIRGVESNGMICSLAELGLEEKYVSDAFKDGIYYFPKAVPLGEDPLKHLGLDQHTLELSLTPNRADLLSVLGFAYDVAAVLDKKITYKEATPFETDHLNPIVVHNESEGCNRYFARTILNVKVGPSPEWLRGTLIASGIRPINNIVDITNYVMLELGTPLHAFDKAKFETDKVVIRDAKDGEEVITLDGVKRTLTKQDVVITNGLYPVALAGVMGLENTMVDEQTTAVILEAASFDAKRIAQTSKRLDLRSDSSLRFERGLDETRVRMAINRAAELLYELANGNVCKEISFSGSPYPKPVKVELTVKDVNRTLGINLDESALRQILKRLNVIMVSEHVYMMPSYRNDLRIKADLIEEVARIYGLNNIPLVLPETNLRGTYSDRQKHILKIKQILRALGFNEVINYSLTKQETIDLYTKPNTDIIELLHPMSEDKKVLRHSLINGLVENVVYHQSRQMDDLKFFEVGRTYYSHEEPMHLSLIMTGLYEGMTWQNEALKASYYTVKGILNSLLDYYDLNPSYEAYELEGLHPGVTAKVSLGQDRLGVVGKLHPQSGLDAFVFEINLEVLLKHVSKQTSFETISRFPNITRDLAFVVDKSIPQAKIEALIKQTAKKFLVDLTLFDVYLDQKIGEDKKSLAYSMTFNAKDKTLEAADIDKLMRSILNRLQFEFKAEIRA
ncbi:MAG: phenylalanine--tRNA ligase subunit beta [Tenericutes bacterium HGW-Tenericutes-8]|nr:MAG: phenylalanine--tRNA ligase subunit beta [Tenericutes bacterium HGW-Tenericutes-8]